MHKPTDQRTTRRAALRKLTASATVATAAFPILGQNRPPETHHSPQPVTKEAAAYKFRFFSREQLETLDTLGETIIPADDHSPGAKAAQVSEYIDAVVADSPLKVQKLWQEGLATVEQMAQRNTSRLYAACSPEQQTEILTAISSDEHPDGSLEKSFFAVLKRAVVDGYYTSRIGIFQELVYQGNTALASFPGCSHETHGDRG